MTTMTTGARSFVVSCWAALTLAAGTGFVVPSRAVAQSERAENLHVDFSAGLGIGGRLIERPIQEGVQRIGPGSFAAADLGVRALVWPEQTLSLGFALRYQTALVDTAWEHAPHAQDTEVRVRCHHVELAAAPTFRPAEDSSWAVGVGLGYAMRVFWPDVHNLQTPRQFITGPYLRPELQVRDIGPFSLHIGPEVFWVVTLDPALRAAIGGKRGLALGVQASIIGDISEQYAIEMMYRESHVLITPELTDVERFLTAVVTRKF